MDFFEEYPIPEEYKVFADENKLHPEEYEILFPKLKNMAVLSDIFIKLREIYEDLVISEKSSFTKTSEEYEFEDVFKSLAPFLKESIKEGSRSVEEVMSNNFKSQITWKYHFIK